MMGVLVCTCVCCSRSPGFRLKIRQASILVLYSGSSVSGRSEGCSLSVVIDGQ